MDWGIDLASSQLGSTLMHSFSCCFAWCAVYGLEFEHNYSTEMCSGSEAGSYLRRIDFVYHSTRG